MKENSMSLVELIQRDIGRYRKKGFKLIAFAAIQAFIVLQLIEKVGYWVWPQVLLTLEKYGIAEWQFAVFFSWIYNMIVFALSNVVFLIIYKLDSPFFEQYKVQNQEKWPWQQDPKAWRVTLNKTIKVILLNNLVIIPIVLFINVALTDYQVSQSFAIEDLPTPWTYVWQLYFCLLGEDMVFTFTHRLLHTSWLYKRVHKLHHTYTMPVSLCAEYAHPVEFILGNMLPLGIPIMMLGKRMHFYTFLMIGTNRIIGTSIGHSGYDFPWDATELFPFRTTSRYHDYHHEGNINGNFGGGTVLFDWLMGYNKGYYKHLDSLKTTPKKSL